MGLLFVIVSVGKKTAEKNGGQHEKGIEKAGEVVMEQCKKISFCVGFDQNKQIGIAKNLPYVLNVQIAYGENICVSMFVKETDLENCRADLNNIFMTSLNFDVDSNNFYF